MQIPGERRRLDRIESFMDLRIERGPKPQAVGKARFPKPPNRTLMLMAGRNEKLRKGDVLGALVKDGNLPPEAIGRIDLMEHACAVAVARVHAQAALDVQDQVVRSPVGGDGEARSESEAHRQDPDVGRHLRVDPESEAHVRSGDRSEGDAQVHLAGHAPPHDGR